jgi:adenine-specific DNA methylase
MIPKDCKRLAEVDFPIAEVSRHAAREKAIRHGHPSTLHLWWARRPLASSRAVLLALLWPDPCDPLCPSEFKEEARRRLPEVPGRNPGATDEDLRRALLKFIADFANWDNAEQRTYLDVSRALVRAAHGDEPPLVVDPFAGGGSISLEALRLGCEVFASDLNPVACLILKVMLEDIPRHGSKLPEELRRVGAEVKLQAEKELADLYPKDLDGTTPIAYLWARTVRCESPNCGTEIPVIKNGWLSKSGADRIRFFREDPGGKCVVLLVDGHPLGGPITFRIARGHGSENQRLGYVAVLGTKAKGNNANVICPCCGTVLPGNKKNPRTATQLVAQRGGAQVAFDPEGRRIGGARLLAIATLRLGHPGRHYRLPEDRDYAPVRKAQERLARTIQEWERAGREGIRPTPDESLPPVGALGFRVQRYGMLQWDDLFTARQKIALAELARATRACAAVPEVVSLALGKLADMCNALCGWTLPDESASVWFTDPPYYKAIPYSDLSDFFFVWLKRALLGHPLLRDPFNPTNPLTPKDDEAVQDETRVVDGRPKDRGFFEDTMAVTFAEGRRILRPNGIGSVVFAHKTTEGWEALLSGMIRGGWTVTGSWPIATEMAHRLRARESAALGTSVHLICRPRPDEAAVGDWTDVIRELPNRVGDWMERLQGEGVRGADLVFACIGPALEIFSRYTKVETADGREVALAEYLERVWEAVGRSALAQVLGTADAKARNGAAGTVEEDARLTALFLWTLQSTDGETLDSADDAVEDEDPSDEEDEEEEASSRGKVNGFKLVADVVRRFAQPLGIELPKWEGRVIETKKGVVRLLPIAERAKQLFGEDGAQAVAARLEQAAAVGTNRLQGMLFPDLQPGAAPAIRAVEDGRRKRGTRCRTRA